MGEILEDIMIIFEGKMLACKKTNFSEPKDLLGMLIGALSLFAEAIYEGGVTYIEFTHLQFNFLKRHNILFVGTCSKKVRQKKALKAIKSIARDFFSQFPPESLGQWDCELSKFLTFEKTLSLSKTAQLLEYIESHWPLSS